MKRIGVVLQGILDDKEILKRHLLALKNFIHPQDIVISTWSDQTLDFDTGVQVISSDTIDTTKTCDHFNLINHFKLFIGKHVLQ